MRKAVEFQGPVGRLWGVGVAPPVGRGARSISRILGTVIEPREG